MRVEIPSQAKGILRGDWWGGDGGQAHIRLYRDKGGVTILDSAARLLGHTAALAFTLIAFAVAADAVSGMIGGESAVKAVMASPASSLISAFHHGGSAAAAIRSGSRASMVGFLAARRQEDAQIRAALDEKKRDPAMFGQAGRRRIWKRPRGRLNAIKWAATRPLDLVYRGAVGRGLARLRDKIDGGGMLRRAGSFIISQLPPYRSYMLATHRHLLRSDPAYAARHVDQARLVSQMRPAAMTPREWAEGMARMIRDARGLEKIALIDRIARDAHTGRSLFIAWGRAGGVGGGSIKPRHYRRSSSLRSSRSSGGAS